MITDNQLIDKWIKELQEHGCSYDDMIRIFKKAGEKYKQILTNDAKNIDCQWHEIKPSIAVEPLIICPDCYNEVLENTQTAELYCVNCNTAK